MVYPIFNLGVGSCDESLFPSLFLYSSVFFDEPDLKHYLLYFNEKDYVDISGDIYQAKGIIEVSSWLRKILPLRRKYHILFNPTGSQMLLNEVRAKYIESVSGLSSPEIVLEQIKFAKGCSTLKELL